MFTEGVPSESGVMRKMGYESTLYKLLKYDCNIPTVMDVTLARVERQPKICSYPHEEDQPRATVASSPGRCGT